MAEPIPDVVVELLVLGEIDEPRASQLRARLAADGDPRLGRIARSNAEILSQYPVAQEVAQLRARAEQGDVAPRALATSRARGRISVAVAAISLAAAVALAWALRPQENADDDAPLVARAPATAPAPDASTPAPSDGVRDKGRRALVVHRQGDARALRDGHAVTAGDLLQLSYNAGDARYGAIVSVDGGGGAVLHFPDREAGDTRLERGLVRLDHAFELDDAPGFERFFFVTSSTRIDAAQVMEAARRLARDPSADTGALALPKAWAQSSMRLPKRARD